MPDPMLWLYLALASAVLFALGNIIDKFALARLKPHEYYFFIGISYLALVLLLPLITPISFSPPLLLATAAGMAMSVGVLVFTVSEAREEISRVIVVYFSEGLFVILFAAAFLGEILTPVKYAGIALILLGVIFISMKKLEFGFRRDLLPVLAVAVIFAAGAVVMKHLLGSYDYPIVLFWQWLGYSVSFLLLLGPQLPAVVGAVRKSGATTIAASTFSNLIIYPMAFVLYAIALTLQKVSIVAPVTATQALFVVIFAALVSRFAPRLFREEITAKTLALKLSCAALIIIGVCLVS